MAMEKVTVEVSYTGNNYSASIPILPGCVTTGKSMAEIKKHTEEIVPFHIDGMREDSMQYPPVFDGEYEFVYSEVTKYPRQLHNQRVLNKLDKELLCVEI
jgi:predicted RNase H-like HicB family nuclease